jgi:hypothetical protein
MFCEKCGTKNIESSNFCANCGNDLKPSKKALSNPKSRKKINKEKTAKSSVEELLWDIPEEEASEEKEIVDDSDTEDEESYTDKVENSDERPKPKKSKVIYYFLAIILMAAAFFYFERDNSIPLTIEFKGNMPSYTVKTNYGRNYQANHQGRLVYRDTLKTGFKRNIIFSFSKEGTKEIKNYIYRWDGTAETPQFRTHKLNFVPLTSEVELNFILEPFVSGAHVIVNNNIYRFLDSEKLTLPKMRIDKRSKFKIEAGIELGQDSISIAYNKELYFQPSAISIISKTIILKPKLTQKFEFKFLVVDELGKKIEGAKVTLGYKEVEGVTDKKGEVILKVSSPPSASEFQPQVRKGRLASISDIPGGTFTYSKPKIEYKVTLAVQDMISMQVVDQNNDPISGVLAKTSNKHSGKSGKDGKISLVAKNRGKSTNIKLSRPGYISKSVDLIIQPGENVFPSPITLQQMDVKIQVIDQLSVRPVPNVKIRIKELKQDIYTTNDAWQPVFDLVVGKTYTFQLTDKSGKYLNKTVKRTITGNGQMIDILLEPKPRLINVQFVDIKNKNMQGVKTKLLGDKIFSEISDKSGKVTFKVYQDTTYKFEYEYETLSDSREIDINAEWQVNQKIIISFKSKVSITAAIGSPEIRVMDPSSRVVIEKGNGSIVTQLSFGTYLIECDCNGGLYEKIVTINKNSFIWPIDCELPIVKGRGAEQNKQWKEAANIYESISADQQDYCEAQLRLFDLKSDPRKLNLPDESARHGKHLLNNQCQQVNNPYFCLKLIPELVALEEYSLAKQAVQLGFRNEGKFNEKNKTMNVELLSYYEKFVLHQETLSKKTQLSTADKCSRLNSLFQQWTNLSEITSDSNIRDNIDMRILEVDSELRFQCP